MSEIREIETRPQQIQQHTIELLEQLLDLAKQGRIREVCVISRWHNGCYNHANTDTDNLISLIGGVEYARFCLAHQLYEMDMEADDE